MAGGAARMRQPSRRAAIRGSRRRSPAQVRPSRVNAVSFRDHFSRRAADYARFRPTYPGALYAELVRLAPGSGRAWDCATGNGQAAVALAGHFERVLATDASRDQLVRAERHERVTYAVAYAERTPAPDRVFDLVTVAAAAHWFDLDGFYAEVRRVTRPGGILALWSYYMCESEPAIDTVIDRYAHQVLGPYWPERMHYNQERYAGLPFPFERVAMSPFHAEARWLLEQLQGFMSTWSAAQRYRDAHGREAIGEVAEDLARAWGGRRHVHLRWPLHMLVGRVMT